jgi:hypothetical protein
MRITVLTTDTLHHRYFLHKLYAELADNLVQVLFETRPYPWARNAKRHIKRHWANPWSAFATNPYFQPSDFGAKVNTFEAPLFFPDGNSDLPVGLSNAYVESVNNEEAARLLDDAASDLLLVYGTGLIKPHVFAAPRFGAINAHGGKLPGYRGLDTNLWATYEGHPEDMRVTWHQVDSELDTGDVYFEEPVPFDPRLSICSLRYFTAVICTEMCLALLENLAAGKLIGRRHEKSMSKYYGPMPWLLKRKTDKVLKTLARR